MAVTKTWGELIEENRARLQFFQEHLQHTADESQAIKHLQEKHSKFLEGVFVEEDEADAVDGAAPVDVLVQCTNEARAPFSAADLEPLSSVRPEPTQPAGP